MNVEQLKSILSEYRPSMRVVVSAEKNMLMETTVLEIVLKLISEPQNSSVSFFGLDNCIVRERGEFTDDVAGAPPYREWLELDMR